MQAKLNRLLLPLLLILCSATVFGQPQDNSPFSRYGIGNLINGNYAPLSSMGNISATYHSPFTINHDNPASYSYLNYTALEVGAYAKFANLESPTQKINTATGNLSYLALGFPVFNPLNRLTQKKDRGYDWGISMGLNPYSQVAYNIIDSTDYGSATGLVFNNHTGEGQLYRLYIGSGWDYKNFSAGFNINYIFGRNRYNTTTSFVDLPSSLNNYFTNETHTSGFTYDLGVQYRVALSKDVEGEEKKDKTYFVAGATFSPGVKVGTNSKFSETAGNFLSGEFYGDTLNQAENVKEKIGMPLEFSGGLALEKSNKWFVGVNYDYGQWSSYKRPEILGSSTRADSLTNSWTIGFGAEITPDARSYNSFLKRVKYRVGAYYGKDPRIVQGQELNNYGITFGFGLPIRLPRGVPSFVNLGFEFGRQGAPEVIQENFFKTTVAFTLNDNTWFYKRKFK